jgi:hypothetical protein
VPPRNNYQRHHELDPFGQLALRAIDRVLSSPGLAGQLGEAAWEQAKD